MSTEHIPQAQRSQEKKQQIFEVSMALFREKGYNQTTMRDICTAANITTGTFYNFFGDKFGILQECIRQIACERDLIMNLTEEKISAPYQTICGYFMVVVDMQEHLGKDLSNEFSYRSPYMLASISTTPSVHYIAKLLHLAAESGSITLTHNPLNTAEYLMSGFMGILDYWRTLSEGESLRDVARRLLPMLFASVTDEPIIIG